MRLPEDLARLPQLRDAALIRIIRVRSEWRVFEISLGGERAFLKQFLHTDARSTVPLAALHLNEAARRLGPGADRVAVPLCVIAESGVLITAAAPGRPLADLLAMAGDEERAALISRVGMWLRSLADGARSRGQFGPQFWIRGLATRRAACTGDWVDQPLVNAHMQGMRDQAQHLRHAAVDRAHLHGDLTPDNLFYDPVTQRLTAIDMPGGEMAVARDMARFLVWLESRRPQPARVQTDGIARADHRALCEVPGLIAPDQQGILRFMIAEILLSYYLDSARQPVRRAALARAMRDWASGGDPSGGGQLMP